MRQLSIRIPDELHERLSLQARATGRSVNTLATQALTAATTTTHSERSRVRAIAAGNGILALSPPTHAAATAASRRQEILDSMRGIGPVLDEILADERSPL